ncbi:MAG: VTT domain-containing protein [Leptospiraceae bacterium]|nr:VTT domain-containing protein [Leptospiraceae bacterium]
MNTILPESQVDSTILDKETKNSESSNVKLSKHSKDSANSLIKLAFQTILTIVILVLIVIGLSLTIREELIFYSEKVVHQIGFWGLLFGMLLSDSLPIFIPPDAFLVFSIAADLEPFWVIVSCSIGSIMGGCISYAIGRFIIPRFSLGRRLILQYEDKLVPYIRKYGFWAVVLSALTPIPYSWMAYTTGSFKMSFLQFFLGSQFRIARMLIYYYAMRLGWLEI